MYQVVNQFNFDLSNYLSVSYSPSRTVPGMSLKPRQILESFVRGTVPPVQYQVGAYDSESLSEAQMLEMPCIHTFKGDIEETAQLARFVSSERDRYGREARASLAEKEAAAAKVREERTPPTKQPPAEANKDEAA